MHTAFFIGWCVVWSAYFLQQVLTLSALQGYYRRDAFIVTQAPLPDTRVDFWRMMYDYDCRSIVCLQDYRKTDSVISVLSSRVIQTPCYMFSRVCATGHIKDPMPLMEKSSVSCPCGRFPPSFIHQVIIITKLMTDDCSRPEGDLRCQLTLELFLCPTPLFWSEVPIDRILKTRIFYRSTF